MSPAPPEEEEEEDKEAKDDYDNNNTEWKERQDNNNGDPEVLRGLVDCPLATDSQTTTFLSTAVVIAISNRTLDVQPTS